LSKGCHNIAADKKILTRPDKILLMGNPNVGKSVFFSELTGINAVSSNYAGTTVNFLEGKLVLGDKKFTLIDVPGTYSLVPTSEAEAVATRFMESGAEAIVCVLDATNLERNLRLALEINQYKIPVIYCLNMVDVAERNGITVLDKLLSRYLDAPVIPTVVVKKQGLDVLKNELKKILGINVDESIENGESQIAQADVAADNDLEEELTVYNDCTQSDKGGKKIKPFKVCGKCSKCPSSGITKYEGDVFEDAKEITRRVVKKVYAKPRFIDKLSEAMMCPKTGVPIAILVLILTIGFIVGAAFVLRNVILLPIINGQFFPTEYNQNYIGIEGGIGIVPLFRWIFGFIPWGYMVPHPIYYGEYVPYVTNRGLFMLHQTMVGEFGIFVISFQWIFGLILPYVFLFYVAFSLLEDTGYMPRFVVLCDNVMRKLGVQGGSLINVLLGFGCAVPAIIGTRAATTKKERLVVSAAICVAIPCISQIAAIFALLTRGQGFHAIYLLVFMVLFLIVIFCSAMFILSKMIKGRVDPILLEVPNLLMPTKRAYFRKLGIRMKHFMKDAEIPMLIAIVIAAVLMGTGALGFIASFTEPFMSFWLGLPGEAAGGLILGIIRREMTAMPLIELGLTPLQAFVAGVVSLLYLPCISVFGILFKELKAKAAILIFLATIVLALLLGGIVNWFGILFLTHAWIAAIVLAVILAAPVLAIVISRAVKKRKALKNAV